MRLRLNYFDQNDSFGAHLPKEGTVERWITSHNTDRWALLKLDEPIDWQLPVSFWISDISKADAPERRIRRVEWLLLKSRWIGHQIGEQSRTSVFVLWVKTPDAIHDGFDAKQLEQLAWGEVQTLSP